MTIINPSNSRNADDTISEVVVSNVQVLSAGTRYDQEEARKDGKAIRSTVVTLMVTPIDAERIALAQAEGELMLTLRHPLDIAPTESPGVSKAALFSNQPKKPEPAVTVKRRPAPAAIVPIVAVAPIVRPHTVETIRAAKRSEDKLAGVRRAVGVTFIMIRPYIGVLSHVARMSAFAAVLLMGNAVSSAAQEPEIRRSR